MPELAEVAFACNQWKSGIGSLVKSIHIQATSRVYRELEPNSVVDILTGSKLSSSQTHGKQMLFGFEGNKWLGLHLGMTGNLLVENSFHKPKKHDALILYQSDKSLVFRDPRQFGRIRLHVGKHPPDWWSELPISMLDPLFKISILENACRRHAKRPIKSLLLDQRYFQGMGNWMADEVLWRAEIHPARLSGKINKRDLTTLFKQIKFVVLGAMKSVAVHGGDPPRGWLFHSRWKDGGTCPKTKQKLVRNKIAGRTSCWCPQIQKLVKD